MKITHSLRRLEFLHSKYGGSVLRSTASDFFLSVPTILTLLLLSTSSSSLAGSATWTANSATPVVDILAYSQAWGSRGDPALANFHAWTERYMAASRWDLNRRAPASLVAEGVEIARVRRKVLASLISSHPAQAIAESVPASIRQLLPPEISSELETRVSGIGDFLVLSSLGAQGQPSKSRVDRFVRFGNRTYQAFVYGRRSGQTTKYDIPLHGIVIDNAMALHEGAMRELEPDESVDASAVIDSSGAAASTNAQVRSFAEVGSTVYHFASRQQISETEARFEAAEVGIRPQPVQTAAQIMTNPAQSYPELSSEAATLTWTTGTKRLLVIRVDFPDRPGAPQGYTDSYIQTFTYTQITPFYQQSSYGLTSLTTTVTTVVYRLPSTSVFYGSSWGQLHADVEAAAATDYDLRQYDLVSVFSAYLGNGWAGLAEVGGTRSWIFGEFDFRVVAHELGHNYGVLHANLWKVNDGNPISASGFNSEYGDDFDVMGANFANDTRVDFNPWFKNELGWLSNSQVKTVTAGTNGIYRINRFDTASVTGLLALKIVKDGSRNYWIGARRNFTTNASMQQGAYILWGYNYNTGSHLLDMTTPGASDQDAALATTTTFSDTAANVSIEPIANGGIPPNEYIDISVTTATPTPTPTPTPTATPTPTPPPQTDLHITITDGKSSTPAGLFSNYTINVFNDGPTAVTGAVVKDLFPATYTDVTFTATESGGASMFTDHLSSGNINDTVTMPVGSSITYKVNGKVSSSATGVISNTATVTAPSAVIDPNVGNNSATDVDAIAIKPNLAVSVTDGNLVTTAGQRNTYTITVTNHKPSDVSGVVITDIFPATFTGVTFTATQSGGASKFTASGSGNINDVVTMPTGSTITYTATGIISSSATGALSNTATVTAPAGAVDPNLADNIATDTDKIFQSQRFECESLIVQAKTPPPAGISPAAWSGVFNSPEASGGAGMYFNATAVSQFITYTVPVITPGTYRVRVGVQTKWNKGKFQLAVNGVNSRLTQDEYSPTLGYTDKDLGTVTIFAAGDQAFEFLVSGRNPDSSGYTLAFDYIELAATNRLESESLKVQSITPVPSGTASAHWFGVFTNVAAASGGAGTYFNAITPTDFITYAVPVVKSGTYHIRVGTQTKSDKGIFQLSINGVKQGFPQDEYSPSVGFEIRDLGTVTFLSAGDQSFTFTVKRRNMASTGYTLAFDYIELIPTNRLETESLKVQAITPVPPGYASARWFGVFSASAASGGAGTYFNAITPNDYITYTVRVAKAGTYHVRVGLQRKSDKGIFQLVVNGTNQGGSQDEYYPNITYAARDLGTVYLNPGDQAFTFIVIGKNPSSSGYTLAFDYIELVP